MKILKVILGTVLGLALFFLLMGIADYLVELSYQIPVIGYILNYPRICPWTITLLPPIISVQSGAAISGKIGKTALPYGIIVILLYAGQSISLYLAQGFTWFPMLRNLLIIILALVVTGYRYAPLNYFKKA